MCLDIDQEQGKEDGRSQSAMADAGRPVDNLEAISEFGRGVNTSNVWSSGLHPDKIIKMKRR